MKKIVSVYLTRTARQVTRCEGKTAAQHRRTLIGMGWNQIIHDGKPLKRGQQDQFVATIVQRATGTLAIAGTSGEITPAFGAFVPHNGHGFRITNELALISARPVGKPGLSNLFQHAPHGPRMPVELAERR